MPNEHKFYIAVFVSIIGLSALMMGIAILWGVAP